MFFLNNSISNEKESEVDEDTAVQEVVERPGEIIVEESWDANTSGQDESAITAAETSEANIFPRRVEFALKLAALSAAQITSLAVAFYGLWTHFSFDVIEKNFVSVP